MGEEELKMRRVLIAGVAVSLLSACAGVGPQPPRVETYETLLARARSGDAEAAFDIAQRYGYPEQYPSWKGMAPDPTEAAIWCAMIRNVKPAAYDAYAARCADMTKSLTPRELESANAIAAAKVAHKTAG
jgi:hypothetical protein